MVSPLFKGGYGVKGILAVSPDGERVAFSSLGAFEGAKSSQTYNGYIASRTTQRWETFAQLPPAEIAPYSPLGSPIDFSNTLEASLTLTVKGLSKGNATYAGTENEFLLHDATAPDNAEDFALAGQALKRLDDKHFIAQYRGASPNLSHLFFLTGAEGGSLSPLLPEAEGDVRDLYDLSTGVEGTRALRLVGVDNAGKPIDPNCPVEPGSDEIGLQKRQNEFNSVAANGNVVFFTTNTNKAFGSECDGQPGSKVPGNPARLFVRIDGEMTLEVASAPEGECLETAPCHTASPARIDFQGANQAGTRVYFTTTQPLVTSDVDQASDLYMAEIGCHGGASECVASEREVTSLALVSTGGATGEPAEVQGAVRIAMDGSRAYFVARGALSATPNSQGASAAKGADNLYVAEPGSRPVFIGELCSGSELSGTVKDHSCSSNVVGEEDGYDTGLWLERAPEAQTAGQDGRYLLFSSYARLTADDADTARDIYRYDAVTGGLVRVSVGEEGHDANGSNDQYDARILSPGDYTVPGSSEGATVYQNQGLNARAISEDGSRILFTTAEPLSSAAINGLENAYEWHQSGTDPSTVSLISTGDSVEPVRDAVISESGRDAFFVTGQGLVPGDTDGAADVYDARIGGGFPAPPAPAKPCEDEGCLSALTTPAPILIAATQTQAPESAPKPAVVKPRIVKPAKKAHKKKSRRTGKRGKRKQGKSARTRSSRTPRHGGDQ
jgi:hypothetical protein